MTAAPTAAVCGDDLRLDGRGAHPHLVGRSLDDDVAILGQRHPRAAAGEAIVRKGCRGATHADQPFALLPRARSWIPLAPSKPLRPRSICGDEMA
jgi:hypothetical protein